LTLGLGFILFRVFDILKPYPIKQAEKLRGGLGIVMDDLVAGIYAHLCARLILFFVK
jgi:phosphatidylglycerophosphatase A